MTSGVCKPEVTVQSIWQLRRTRLQQMGCGRKGRKRMELGKVFDDRAFPTVENPAGIRLCAKALVCFSLAHLHDSSAHQLRNRCCENLPVSLA